MHMRIRFILILVFSSCLCFSCQPSPISTLTNSTPITESTATPLPDPDIEEYAVYNALLESEFSSDNIDQIMIVDQSRIESRKRLEEDLENFQRNTALSPELVASFIERNQQPHRLKPILEFRLEYQLLTQEEVDILRPLDEASGWKLFHEKYPKTSPAFVYLSRIGYNIDYSQALVYMSRFHYEQPIDGGYYFMVKQDGHWVIESSYIWTT